MKSGTLLGLLVAAHIAVGAALVTGMLNDVFNNSRDRRRSEEGAHIQFAPVVQEQPVESLYKPKDISRPMTPEEIAYVSQRTLGDVVAGNPQCSRAADVDEDGKDEYIVAKTRNDSTSILFIDRSETGFGGPIIRDSSCASIEVADLGGNQTPGYEIIAYSADGRFVMFNPNKCPNAPNIRMTSESPEAKWEKHKLNFSDDDRDGAYEATITTTFPEKPYVEFPDDIRALYALPVLIKGKNAFSSWSEPLPPYLFLEEAPENNAACMRKKSAIAREISCMEQYPIPGKTYTSIRCWLNVPFVQINSEQDYMKWTNALEADADCQGTYVFGGMVRTTEKRILYQMEKQNGDCPFDTMQILMK